MEWNATSRYDVAAAPGGLGLVHDFLNTSAAGKPRLPDLLGGVAPAQQWVDAAARSWALGTGGCAPSIALTEPDCRALRDIRTSLLTVLVDRTHRVSEDVGSAGPVGRVGAKLEIELRADGIVQIEPSGTGWRALAGWILSEVYRAQQSGEWQRLKACRNDRCRGVFYDRSRNNSGVWHDVRSCGNSANLRASRARRSRSALA